jgi:hypothetical protein
MSSQHDLSYAERKLPTCILYFRIPFTLAGTVYGKYLAVDLGTFALKGPLLNNAKCLYMIDIGQ